MPARAEFVRDPDPDAVNQLWDAVVAGERSHDGRDAAGRDWREPMQTVQRHAQRMPGPDPQFGQVLRNQLLNAVDVPVPAGTGRRAVQVPAPRRIGTARHRHERAWRGWVELAAVAVILLAIFGQFILPASESTPEPRQAIAPFVATPGGSSGESAFFRGTPGRTGQYPGAGVADAVAPLWEHEAPFAEFSMGQLNLGVSAGSSAIVAADETLYLSAGGNIEALDPATGETIWSQEAVRLGETTWVDPVVGPVVADGLVVYASRARGSSAVAIAALDSGTGEQRWSQLVQMKDVAGLGWDVSSPLIAEGKVYLAVDSGRTPAPPAYADGRIFTGSGYTSSRLLALDLNTGDEMWRVPASWLGAYDAEDGHEIWTSQSQANAVTVADGRLHVVVGVGENKGIITLAAATGAPLWSLSNPDPTILPLAVDRGLLIAIGTEERAPSPDVGFARLRVIDAATGAERRVIDLGQVAAGSVSAPSIVGGEVYALAAAAGFGAIVLRVPLDEDAEATYLALSLDTHSLVDVLVADGQLFGRGERVVAYGPAGSDAAGTSHAFEPLPAPLSCDFEPRSGTPPYTFTGTPAASLSGVSHRGERSGSVPVVDAAAVSLIGDVPTEDQRALRTAIARVVTCQAVGETRQYLALFSDDFFRRPGQPPFADRVWNTVQISEVGSLPDGRLAVRAEEPGGAPFIVVFVEEDGAWLIDEAAVLR